MQRKIEAVINAHSELGVGTTFRIRLPGFRPQQPGVCRALDRLGVRV